MKINEIVIEATENAKRHDWGNMTMLEHLALFCEEIGEACDCVRKDDLKLRYAESGKPEGLPSEIADIVIRASYMAGVFGLPLNQAIEEKLKYNRKRPKNHDKKI